MRPPRINRFNQRGYLYLSTGANGAGKTLFTIFDVRQLQLQTSRPVYFWGFTAKQPLLDFGWIEHDMRDWMSLPDGSICIWDECQNEITGLTAEKAQEFEKKILSEHRKRGFDFYFCTPHPMNMGAFVRRTIASPGWHRHFKASTIALNSNELKWTSTNTQPEKPNSGASGTVTSRTHPKEVYEWYSSTVGDTAVRKIPKRVWLAILAVIVAIGMIVGAVLWAKHLYADWSTPALVKEAVKPGATALTPATAATAPAQDKNRTLTAAEYAASYQPRIDGMAYSAPRYDAVMSVKQAPKPAACVDGVKRGTKARVCQCWSQQATLLQMPLQVCQQIAAGGYFDDSMEPQQQQSRTAPTAAAPASPQVQSATFASFDAGSVIQPPDTKSTVARDVETLQFMAKRKYIQ